MSDSKLCCSLAKLASPAGNLKSEFLIGDNEKFFIAVEAVMKAAKELLASVDIVLDKVVLEAKSEPMEMSLSDVSTNTSGIVSANTSGLLLDDSATSKSDGEDCVGLAEN
jgi:hypothetical protein